MAACRKRKIINERYGGHKTWARIKRKIRHEKYLVKLKLNKKNATQKQEEKV